MQAAGHYRGEEEFVIASTLLFLEHVTHQHQ